MRYIFRHFQLPPLHVISSCSRTCALCCVRYGDGIKCVPPPVFAMKVASNVCSPAVFQVQEGGVQRVRRGTQQAAEQQAARLPSAAP